MLCPRCGSIKSIVSNSRARDKYGVTYEYVRRRKKCLNCGAMFTTYETTKEPKSIAVRKAVTTLNKIKTLIVEPDLEM